MSNKLLFVFACAAVGTFFGYTVLTSYRKNYLYLDGICGLIDELKRNLSYKKDAVIRVLVDMNVQSAQLMKNIDEYVRSIGNADGVYKLSRGFLPKATYDRVCELFSALGVSDESGQQSQLSAFSESFSALRSDADAKLKKQGGAAVKLGFLCGLGMGILLL